MEQLSKQISSDVCWGVLHCVCSPPWEGAGWPTSKPCTHMATHIRTYIHGGVPSACWVPQYTSHTRHSVLYMAFTHFHSCQFPLHLGHSNATQEVQFLKSQLFLHASKKGLGARKHTQREHTITPTVSTCTRIHTYVYAWPLKKWQTCVCERSTVSLMLKPHTSFLCWCTRTFQSDQIHPYLPFKYQPTHLTL